MVSSSAHVAARIYNIRARASVVVKEIAVAVVQLLLPATDLADHFHAIAPTWTDVGTNCADSSGGWVRTADTDIMLHFVYEYKTSNMKGECFCLLKEVYAARCAYKIQGFHNRDGYMF